MQNQKSRGVAMLLALFLGGLGAHKFYLRKNTAGILYLLFCWTFIPSIIALFEFIGLMLKGEKSFNQKYNSPLTVANTAPASVRSNLDELSKLAELKEKSVITEEEFQKKKRELLG